MVLISVRNIGESVEGIATCKSYGWETPFFRMIRALRASETDAIIGSQRLKALNKAFDYCMVPSCNLAMFTVYWAVGGQVTLAKVRTVYIYMCVYIPYIPSPQPLSLSLPLTD